MKSFFRAVVVIGNDKKVQDALLKQRIEHKKMIREGQYTEDRSQEHFGLLADLEEARRS